MELQNRIFNATWLASSTIYATLQGGNLFTFYLAVICTFCYAEWHIMSSRPKLEPFRYLGFLLIFMFQQCLFYMRQMNVHYVYTLFCIVWANDTGAYIGGKFVSKMENVWRFPDYINRKKTFLGSLTGIALGTTIGIYFDASLSTSFILSVVSQIGDMLESRAKRLADMKDSNLEGFEISGHGGILDRIDALIFTTPVAFFFFRMH